MCSIHSAKYNKIPFVTNRSWNGYTMNFDNLKCFLAVEKDSCLWLRRLGHANMKLLNKFSNYDILVGLPKIKFGKDEIFDACQMIRKQKKKKSQKSYFYI